MTLPRTILLIAGVTTLASLTFTGLFLWYQAPEAGDGTVAKTSPSREQRAGASNAPADLPASAYRDVVDGLRVADIQVGTGAEPDHGDGLLVHYTGWLKESGTAFDSSLKRGEPIAFALGTGPVIQGWHKGIQGMRVGGKRQLVIPPDLAYGPEGRPPIIPANSTLIFDVELVAVRKPPVLGSVQWLEASTLAEGVQVVDLSPGDGQQASDRSILSAEITIWKQTGDLFYSSYQMQGGPISSMLGVPPPDGPPLTGIGIAAAGMKPGGSRIARLPPAAAFGDRGIPGQIAPGETVIVQIDAIDVSAPRVPLSAPPSYDPKRLVETASGLKYVDLEPGAGASPRANDMVLAEYTGWLESGKIFDSSYNRAEGFRFQLQRGRVIKAWDEAVSTMRPGGKRLIIAPPDLAYGDRGAGADIGPGATLVFLIELISFDSP